ncbi:MAG: tetratricopeptide repeat protein [Candidatus Sumerlaeia bacterium]|nr:tetratricopeptide repeat protein [Candidatus Sumerlaeia bacterium]
MSIFPLITRLRPLAMGSILLVAFLVSGCGQKTPEDKLEEAQKLLQERQTPLAILKLRDLIREHPEEDAAIDARFGLAMIYTQLGREENLEAARDLYQQLYDMLGVRDQRGLEAFSQLIVSKLEEENFDAAFAMIDTVIEELSDDPPFQTQMKIQRAMLQLLSEQEDKVDEGVEFLMATMVEHEDRSMRGQTRELLARHYREEGRFDESSAVYTHYLESFPEDPVKPMLILTMAINSKLAGNTEAKERYLEEGKALMDEKIEEELNLNRRAEHLNDLAQLLAVAEDFEGAEAAYRRIMADQPATRTALDAQFAIGQMYINANELDKAEDLFRQIRQENANTPVEEMAERGISYVAQMREYLASQEAAGEEIDGEEEAIPTIELDGLTE